MKQFLSDLSSTLGIVFGFDQLRGEVLPLRRLDEAIRLRRAGCCVPQAIHVRPAVAEPALDLVSAASSGDDLGTSPVIELFRHAPPW